MLDGETFELKGNWENECEAPPTGYDFCYQPRHNVLVSSAGIVPRRAGRGFDLNDLKKGAGPREGGLSRSHMRRRQGLGVLGWGRQPCSSPRGPVPGYSGGTSSNCPQDGLVPGTGWSPASPAAAPAPPVFQPTGAGRCHGRPRLRALWGGLRLHG